jgi:large subunit ribosomal protein L32
MIIFLAVPKGRTSKKKSNQRKANWKRKVTVMVEKVISKAKSILSGKKSNYLSEEDVKALKEKEKKEKQTNGSVEINDKNDDSVES